MLKTVENSSLGNPAAQRGCDMVEGEASSPTRLGFMSHLAVYPGSFDPFTLGHLNIVERIAPLFDKLIIGVGINREKRAWFSGDMRADLIRQATKHLPNLEVQIYEGLTVRFVRELGARVMVRGVRPITDIQAELTMMMANRRLAPDIETLFLVADGELAHVSSSLIKEIEPVADAAMLRSFLPEPVLEAVLQRQKLIDVSSR